MGTTVGFSDDRLGDEVIWQIVDPRPPLSVLGPPPPIPEPVVPPEISLPPAAWVMLLGVALLILFLKRRQDEIEVRSWRR